MTAGKAKLGAAVIDQVVFGIEAPMPQLGFLVRFSPLRIAPLFGDRKKCWQERLTHSFGKREIEIPISRAKIIVEDAAYPPGTAPMRDEKVVVGPLLEFGAAGTMECR